MAELTFTPEGHLYRLDGVPIPSTSQIIHDMGLTSFPPGIDWQMTRGTHVHRATQLYDEGDLEEDSLDPVIMPYLKAYKRFKTETLFAPHHIEEPMYHPSYLYAGTVDRIGAFGVSDSHLALVDIKSGSPYPAVSLQCAAYTEMAKANSIPVRRAFAVYLKPDGTYRMDEIRNMRRALNVFLSALTLYTWKKEVGIDGKGSNIQYRTRRGSENSGNTGAGAGYYR